MITTIFFDFGGVLAEEGFREGLWAIAENNNLDASHFYETADRLIFESGYLTGGAGEAEFWNLLRERTGIRGADQDLRREILSRFVLRPHMIAYADHLRARGFRVSLLSDQTNWLEELDRRFRFLDHFDRVFNSYRFHSSKRVVQMFKDVCHAMNVDPAQTIFIDDNEHHIGRARSIGMNAILFTGLDGCRREIERLTALS
jgi:putative hydrolase of the HAD superfamily